MTVHGPAGVVESPNHTGHFGGASERYFNFESSRAVIISLMHLVGASLRLELQRPAVVEFADMDIMVPVCRVG